MGRPAGAAGKRTEVVALRLTPEECARIDSMRGSLTRGQWLRWLQKAEEKRRGL